VTGGLGRDRLNRRVKRWPGWLLLAVIAAGLLAAGAARSGGAGSNLQRADAISKQLRCPVCAGESVYESRVASAVNIREEVKRQVSAGRPDAVILADVQRRFPDTTLVPAARGVNALLWVLPVMVLVAGAGGLTVVFRRWRAQAAATPAPTDDDRALVAAALAAPSAGAGTVVDLPDRSGDHR
jgi:cytochrome c-type biogenesis protein CcmH